MKITRRAATELDTEFARLVHHRAYRDVVERQFGGWNEHDQDRFFAGDWRDAQFEMILADGVPCGYLCIEERSHDIHVRELLLSPEFQGQGIGTSILREVQERARARHVPVHLGTFHQNRALDLYRRLDFEEIGRTDTHVALEWNANRALA
jgi:ribosomal protein S18 acetylase RimI-like enzyme